MDLKLYSVFQSSKGIESDLNTPPLVISLEISGLQEFKGIFWLIDQTHNSPIHIIKNIKVFCWFPYAFSNGTILKLS